MGIDTIDQQLARLRAKEQSLNDKLYVVGRRIFQLEEEKKARKPISASGTGVYVIRCQDHFKIGFATDIESRLTMLQIGNPYDLKVVIFISCSIEDARILELELHEKYGNFGKRGEWFALRRPELKEIIQLGIARSNGNLLQALFDQENIWAEEIPRFQSYIPIPVHKKTTAILKIIRDVQKTVSGAVPYESILIEATKIGMEREETLEILTKMRRDGDMFEPRPGTVKVL